MTKYKASHFETPKAKKKGVLGGLFKRKKGGSSASSVSGVSRVSSNHSMASKYSAVSRRGGGALEQTYSSKRPIFVQKSLLKLIFLEGNPAFSKQ